MSTVARLTPIASAMSAGGQSSTAESIIASRSRAGSASIAAIRSSLSLGNRAGSANWLKLTRSPGAKVSTRRRYSSLTRFFATANA